MSELISKPVNAAIGNAIATTTSAHVSTFVGRGGSIPDGQGSFTDDIIVKDNFKVTDVTVTLYNLAHTWVGDLTVQLHHLGTGKVVDLIRRPGQPHFSSSGFSHDLKGDYSFNDHHTLTLESAAGCNSVIPAGNYTSTDPLKAFYGVSATGTWRLVISDCFPGDSGSFASWKLDLGWG